MQPSGPFGITTRFQELYPTTRQVSHALLTRSPLSPTQQKPSRIPFDLHVLSTPPAFVLSQNQTLHKKTSQKTQNKPTKKKKTKSTRTPNHPQAAKHLTQKTCPPQAHHTSTPMRNTLAIKKQKPNQKQTFSSGIKSSTKHAIEFSNHHHTTSHNPQPRRKQPRRQQKKQYTTPPHTTTPRRVAKD